MAGRVASRIALFVVGAIPGAAGFFAGQPVLGGALLVLCEALVAVGSIFGDVAGELRKRWTARLVDRVDAAVGRRIARFERVYRAKMLGSFRFMDSKGLPTKGFFTPELDDVYVHVKVAPGAPHKVRADLLAEAPLEVAERHQLGDFLDQPDPQILAVIGAPGSGKTTLLRHTAREACVRHRGRRRTTPVLLYLRDHVDQIVRNPSVALPALIRRALARQGITDPDGWFEGRLRAGRCLVLLDGLDEVARAEHRSLIAEWVDAQVTRYATNDFVITSRPAGYRTAEIDNAKVLQVCNFNSEQVRTFVQRWYLALEKWATRADVDTIRDRAHEAASDLLDRLDRAPALYELTVNPLLLTMIANVHHHRGALPGSRVDLYGEICQAMLWRRQEAKKLSADDVPGEKKEALLRRLAFVMMEREVRDLPRAEVLSLIRPTLRRVSRDLTADDFLADVSSNGLIIERESGLFSFAHLTFQEYLAASHIRDRGRSKVLADNVDNVWWRETTLLYTARSDADEIVLACLESSSVPALSLAYDCVDENSELDPELRDQLEELLGTAFKPDTDAEQRRLMTAVVVMRHLRQVVRTDTGLVCARPITNQIYRLFLQDTDCPQPDGFDRSRPDADLVVGVRHKDAGFFAEWAGAITGNVKAYRLVASTEVETADVQRAISASAPNARKCSVWLNDPSRTPFLWSRAKGSWRHEITSATLAQQVRLDVEVCLPSLFQLLLLRMVIEADYGDRLREICTRYPYPQHWGFLTLSPELATTFNTMDNISSIAFSRGLTPEQRKRFFNQLLDGVNPTLAGGLALKYGVNDALTADQIMGTTLSRSLGQFLPGNTSFTSWDHKFTKEFLDHITIADTVHMVTPGAMESEVSSVSAMANDIFQAQYDNPKHAWSGKVFMTFNRLWSPAFSRKTPMTAKTAAALRLSLFCLAEEEFAKGNELSLDLQRLAAGTMVMEMRASGALPPTETILLAVS